MLTFLFYTQRRLYVKRNKAKLFGVDYVQSKVFKGYCQSLITPRDGFFKLIQLNTSTSS